MSSRNFKIHRYVRRLKTLFLHPFFWFLTVIGNSIVIGGSILLYHFERDSQPSSLEFIDCLLWSAETVTTVGQGYHAPYTLAGKITLLLLMFTGPVFIWSYMGLLVTVLIAPELNSIEKEVHDVEKELQELRKN
jgi:Trk-type K+ transport system membrane component